MILYVLEIKNKNGWKKLVKFESSVFHYLSQKRGSSVKQDVIMKYCDLIIIRVTQIHDLNHLSSLI